jgi:hypothetical protein
MTDRTVNNLPAATHGEPVRCLFAIELSTKSWVIAFNTPLSEKISRRTLTGCNAGRAGSEAIQLVFAKFRELWSVRQTFQWFRDHDLELKAFEQYDAVDARNRLAASELERRWNGKLEEIEADREPGQ